MSAAEDIPTKLSPADRLKHDLEDEAAILQLYMNVLGIELKGVIA